MIRLLASPPPLAQQRNTPATAAAAAAAAAGVAAVAAVAAINNTHATATVVRW